MGPGLRRALVYGPLALLLPLMWALSSGQVAVRPVAWVAMVAVVVAGAWAAAAEGRPRAIDFLPAALMGIAATHRLLFPGFVRGHDIETHLWGTYGFFQAIQAGNWLPRWIHQLGLGMPFLMFYPPVAFYLMLPFHALHVPVYDAFKYGFMLYSALAGMSMYFAVSRWTGSRPAALVAAGAYCFAPYHLLESNYRVAVAEAAAMAVLPLFFYYAHRAVAAPDRRNLALAATWTAALTLTHPLSLSMAGTAMGVWLLAVHRLRFNALLRRSLLSLALVGVLGVATAGYYTLPVAAESSYVTIGDTLGGSKSPMYFWHGLWPQQLLERREWSRWQKSEKRDSKEEKNEMPFYFGLSLLALLPAAVLGGRRSGIAAGEGDASPIIANPMADPGQVPVGLLALTLATLALTLTPLDMAFAWFPPMKILQFSWRFLEIATFGACALTGFAVLRLTEAAPPWLVRVLPATVLAVLVLDFFPYGGAPMWSPPYKGVYQMSGTPVAQLPLRVDRMSFPPSDSTIDLSNLRREYPEYFTKDTRNGFLRAKDREEEMLERAGVAITFRKGARGEKLNPSPYAEFIPDGGSAALAVGGTGAAVSLSVGETAGGGTKGGDATGREATGGAGETGTPPAAGAVGVSQALEFTRAGEQIRVKLPGAAGRLVIKEQWFPGWVATLGSSRMEPDRTEDGLMTFELSPTDTGDLTLKFSRTRWDRLGGILLSSVCLIGLWFPRRRKGTGG